ncbi:GH3 auxin-responsive promoter family protein [uncultured Mesonia sp.]|uniref:GH3 auxin-responsive promoter family protein n=1 Tax=uncultured Mesonia sp. TaxID=399731 RepID=UPI00374E8DB7
MSIKSFAAKIFAKVVKAQIDSWANNPVKAQEKVFNQLIKQAQHTQFGQDHQFSKIKNQQDFSNLVPVKDYEALKPYIERVKQGEQDILWPGRPIYFAKTSGTTSGAKYIPITKESMPSHIKGARNAILSYINETGNSDFVNGKMIFLQGSPVLHEENGIKVGRLSGIVAHFVPRYLQKNRMPSWEVNCIEDWETKVEAIINETISADMRVFSGIPSWLQMYFERLQERTGKTITEIFPNFNLLIYGGVNFEPYRPKFESLIGKPINSIELFPASEGFFAYQDSQKEKGMLLRLDAGIYYEFIDADSFFEENPERIGIADVALGVNYVMIISTNAGLWAYNLGDTVIFTSLKPYRVLVSGRIKHFTSAFGEHVIAKEVEEALQQAVAKHRVEVSEFSVAPQTNPETGLPYHEWFIEFNKQPDNLTTFAQSIDEALQNQNSYYQDLIQGKILKTLVISPIVENGFQRYMKAIGKLGGQNKLPRLTNDRQLADKLYELKLVESNDE